MISRLRGNVLELGESMAVVDVAGVGYELEITTGAAAMLAAANGIVELHTHLSTRDDGQALYGFADAVERDLFRELIKVAGVGPKLALTLLSGVSPDAFRMAVAQGDLDTLTRVPGIGKRTASRLAVELRDKVDATVVPAALKTQAAREAVQALTGLGYRAREATAVVKEVTEVNAAAKSDGADVQEIVRASLKRLAA